MSKCVRYVQSRCRFIVLFVGSISVSVQSPIGNACAKVGLKAVEVINNAPKSDEARPIEFNKLGTKSGPELAV